MNQQKRRDELDIDPLMQPLINELWEHQYETIACCQGGFHRGKKNKESYVALKTGTGDNWFDDQVAKSHGFSVRLNYPTCHGGDFTTPAATVYRGLLKNLRNNPYVFTNVLDEMKRRFIKISGFGEAWYMKGKATGLR